MQCTYEHRHYRKCAFIGVSFRKNHWNSCIIGDWQEKWNETICKNLHKPVFFNYLMKRLFAQWLNFYQPLTILQQMKFLFSLTFLATFSYAINKYKFRTSNQFILSMTKVQIQILATTKSFWPSYSYASCAKLRTRQDSLDFSLSDTKL